GLTQLRARATAALSSRLAPLYGWGPRIPRREYPASLPAPDDGGPVVALRCTHEREREDRRQDRFARDADRGRRPGCRVGRPRHRGHLLRLTAPARPPVVRRWRGRPHR